MKPDWKAVSQLVAETHSELGGSVVAMDADVPDPTDKDPVPLMSDEDLYRSPGSELYPKKIRGWLWKHRKADWMGRDDVLLCSYYDEEHDVSFVGAYTLGDE